MSDRHLYSCLVCEAEPGEPHSTGCPLETCPQCGRLLQDCTHFRDEEYGEEEGVHPVPPEQDRVLWQGDVTQTRTCWQWGWCMKPDLAGEGWVRCGRDDAEAQPDLARLNKEASWDRRQRRFLRPEDAAPDTVFIRKCLPAFHADTELKVVTRDVQREADDLREMQQLGVTVIKWEIDEDGNEYPVLTTTNPEVASRFGFRIPDERFELDEL